jgi:uncharacterized membrane-anchored protein
LGETGGDLLAQTLNVGYATSTIIFFSFFLIAGYSAIVIEALYSTNLLGSYRCNQYSRHYYVGLHG